MYVPVFFSDARELEWFACVTPSYTLWVVGTFRFLRCHSDLCGMCQFPGAREIGPSLERYRILISPYRVTLCVVGNESHREGP
jgi:hypothetical protein